MNAATHPVQAPVTGKGIPTKRTNPQNSNVSTSFPFRRVRANSQEKKRSHNFHCRSHDDTGSKKKRIIKAMT